VDRFVHSPQGAAFEAQAAASAATRPQPQGATPENRAARTDMELFASVGAESCDVSITDEAKQICDFADRVEIERAIDLVPGLINKCNAHSLNLIVRPRIASQRVDLIPLDDLPPEVLAQVQDFSFRCIETSPGNFQAWVAVREMSYGFDKRLKQALKADMGANGASRVAGSLNVKPKYFEAFGVYPVVRIVAAQPGLIVLESDLAELGGTAALIDSPPVGAPLRRRPIYKPSLWPYYEDGQLDRSNEDYHFVHQCFEHGWQFWPDEIVAKLLEVSSKAQQRGEAYARLVVRKALGKHGIVVEFQK